LLRIEKKGHVVVWTIDRPEAKNALDHATLDALARAVRDAADDTGIRAAVLTGAGDAFVSGGDLRELRGRDTPEDAQRFSDAGFDLTSAMAALPFPVLGALPGAAIGGGAELALACDMRIAHPRATIAFKQVRMGVTTAWGTVPRLLALAPSGLAARLLFACAEITAADAHAAGLVDEVTGDPRATALAWAEQVTLASPTAVAEMKRLLRESLAQESRVRAVERSAFTKTWSGHDHKEAVEAYFERRPARWAPRTR
jgi:enoyl-CoA hydratase